MDIHGGITRIIAQLTSAIMNMRLYSANHPHVFKHSAQALQNLILLLEIKPELTFFLVGDELIADLIKLPAKESYIEKFIRILTDKGLERITFMKGLEDVELFRFIEQLAQLDAPSINSTLHIQLGKVEINVNADLDQSGIQPIDPKAAADASINQLRNHDLGKIRHLYHQIKTYAPINMYSIDEMVKVFITGFRRDINPLQLLAQMKSSDEYTFTHVVNVGLLTLSQARRLGFVGEYLHKIGIAAMLHDVGKLFVPKNILNKPGLLTREERDIMETHTLKGAKYLLGLPETPKLAILAALEHHVKFDGGGYPQVEKGRQPNIVSQMITISDVFDALRSKRVYKKAKPKRVIVKILKNERGSTFNPQLVDLFLEMIGG